MVRRQQGNKTSKPVIPVGKQFKPLDGTTWKAPHSAAQSRRIKKFAAISKLQ